MTSKHCFSKVMREDFRHKTWMLALSVLGNLLAIPVAFLIYSGRRAYYTMSINSSEATPLLRDAQVLANVFSGTLPIAAGIIAIAGAVIVGLFGFRYVFHRNMTDTYHSMPVKRRTLFLAGWLNGLLIWFVPFLVSLLITLLIGEVRLASIRNQFEALTVVTAEEMGTYQGSMTGGQLFSLSLRFAVVLLVAFLLVYHLVLLAVMLCGNVLNTLVTTAVLGGGVVSVYLLVQAFCASYLNTFVPVMSKSRTSLYAAVHASPFADAVYVLYEFCEEGGDGLSHNVLISLVIALVLGCLAFVTYLKRPSELAEQGTKNRLVCLAVQFVGSLCAAFSGWLIFMAVTNETLAWSVFGTLLAGVMAFGVLNVIFNMDFKAFFRRKPVMLAVLAVGLLTGFAFEWDWAGYDRYLPAEEEIAEISVYSYRYTNVNGWSGINEPDSAIEKVHIRNAEAAYAFLRDVSEPEKVSYGEPDENGYAEEFYAKVTLKNGRSYYRRYIVSSRHSQSVLALLTTPEYMEISYMVDDETLAECSAIQITRGDETAYIALTSEQSREMAEAVVAAYNRDAAERPEALLSGGSRTYCTVSLLTGRYTSNRSLEVNDEMENTIAALKEYGYAAYVEPVPVEDVAEIRLGIYLSWRDSQNDEIDLVEIARSVYEVPAGEGSETQTPEVIVNPASTERVDFVSYDDGAWLRVTESSEIGELLEMISYEYSDISGGVFRGGCVTCVQIVLKDGQNFRVMLPTGKLPEKYILRFGTL